MKNKHAGHLRAVCGKTFPNLSLVPGTAVRDPVAKEIVRDHPDWSPENFICRPDLAKYRAKYIHFLLESEKGELTTREQDVLDSIKGVKAYCGDAPQHDDLTVIVIHASG